MNRFKKQFFILMIVLILPVILTGCFKKTVPIAANPTGGYHYNNDYLYFSLDLPAEFQYFQTQKKDGQGYTDLEIYVPTADKAYLQEVPGYGKVMIVRVYNNKDYKQEVGYLKVGEGHDKIYTIQTWLKSPKDWQKKWTEEMQNTIIKSFKVL